MTKERVQNDVTTLEVFFKSQNCSIEPMLMFPPISRCSRNDGWFDLGWTQGTLVT